MIKKKFKDKYFIIWPQYFDSTLSRKEGRRVPKSLAVPRPTQKDLEIAVKGLGRDYITLGGRYPRQWWLQEGALAVEKKEGESKRALLILIAGELRKRKFQKG